MSFGTVARANRAWISGGNGSYLASDGYTYRICTSTSGNFFTFGGGPLTIDAFLIGGGGGGGTSNTGFHEGTGGGGSGEIFYVTNIPIVSTASFGSTLFSIGAGGTTSSAISSTLGQGESSSLQVIVPPTYTAYTAITYPGDNNLLQIGVIGGNYGGDPTDAANFSADGGSSAGSGGGGAAVNGTAGAAGVAAPYNTGGLVNDGGVAAVNNGGSTVNYYNGGGGGGAGAVGSFGVANHTGNGGAGGAGYVYANDTIINAFITALRAWNTASGILGAAWNTATSSGRIAGGGGGGSANQFGGLGGSGGGGQGNHGSTAANGQPSAGTPYTGGGGGGATGGAGNVPTGTNGYGGSGLIAIRYKTNARVINKGNG